MSPKHIFEDHIGSNASFKVNYFLFVVFFFFWFSAFYIIIHLLSISVKLNKYFSSQIQVLNRILFRLLMKMLVLLNREQSDLQMVCYKSI